MSEERQTDTSGEDGSFEGEADYEAFFGLLFAAVRGEGDHG